MYPSHSLGIYYIISHMKFDLRQRTRDFGVRIIKLVKKFPRDIASHELGKQLIRSGTSIGANFEEADAASSRKDFLYKCCISCKEAKETNYWLDIILRSEMINNIDNINEAKALAQEANELSKIFYTIYNPKKDKIQNENVSN